MRKMTTETAESENIYRYGKDRKTKYKGICTHGVVFYDTLTGINTKCEKCSNRGKVTGYWKQRLEGKLKKVM
jgi:hypothetical protein